MKRIFALILALLHLAATTGATVYVHHCMGREVGASISAESDEELHSCSHCGMQKKKSGNGCCKDEVRIVKCETDGTLAKVAVAPVTVEAGLPAVVYPFIITPAAPLVAAVDEAAACPHAPPLRRPVPIYLEICSLRI